MACHNGKPFLFSDITDSLTQGTHLKSTYFQHEMKI
ncbi:MAG: hypothetical protein K0S09_2780 [Sphingobacteriaceae bacterium]|jgi:hypothetical protein|nr:hypothetical protein [Sphingobacteriaceae bacterium]